MVRYSVVKDVKDIKDVTLTPDIPLFFLIF